jgi:hypothetical protein
VATRLEVSEPGATAAAALATVATTAVATGTKKGKPSMLLGSCAGKIRISHQIIHNMPSTSLLCCSFFSKSMNRISTYMLA